MYTELVYEDFIVKGSKHLRWEFSIVIQRTIVPNPQWYRKIVPFPPSSLLVFLFRVNKVWRTCRKRITPGLFHTDSLIVLQYYTPHHVNQFTKYIYNQQQSFQPLLAFSLISIFSSCNVWEWKQAFISSFQKISNPIPFSLKYKINPFHTRLSLQPEGIIRLELFKKFNFNRERSFVVRVLDTLYSSKFKPYHQISAVVCIHCGNVGSNR